MRRLLLAVAVFLTATATPTFAGYLILRVLLAGGDGVPGPGGAGQPVGPGGPMAPPGGATPGVAEVDPSRSVVIVIPLETEFLEAKLDPKKNFHPENNPKYRKIEFQQYGQKYSASLFVDNTTIQFFDELSATPGVKKTRATEVREKYQSWVRTKSEPKVLFDAIELALQYGQVKDALLYADELVVVAAEKKFALPERDVKPFVAAWGAMQKAVTDRANQPSDAETWKIRLDAKNVRPTKHYAIISWDAPTAELDRRATQLDDNFAAFYLWHATRGVVLPVPSKPLVAVLAPDPAKIHELHKALDGLPRTDAFFAPDHNLLVLSPVRMDDIGQTFLRQNQQVFVKGFNREQLLTGTLPALDATEQNGSRPDDVARAATLAAVEKLVLDEADIAAVSREGNRQLMYVSGVLPKHVTLPNWLTNGAVNFFTRPRGPAYVTVGDDDKPNMHVALTTGYGGPNYVHHRYFRDLTAKKELPASSDRLLENVLGDVYFNGIKNGDDPDPAPPSKKAKQPAAVGMGGDGGGQPMPPMVGGATPPTDQEDPAITLRKKQNRLEIKAHATSWALYYYLAKSQPEQLKRYVAELNKLPRDLPIDGRTAYAVFIRVFKLSATDDGPADPAALKKFADEWLAYIGTVQQAGHDVPLPVVEAPKPVGPGGIPGGPKLPGSGSPRG